MSYLSLSNITKTYDHTTVLNGVSLVLNAGQRLGLVGANGVGKSTLLKIITGEIQADSGSITRSHTIGYLAQVIAAIEGQSLRDMIATSMQHVYDLERRMRDLELQMAVSEAALLEYGDVAEQFERYGGYELDSHVAAVLNGLGVGHIPREQMFATLSGGEKSRVALALLLLQAPDVLLLDEPTNHLDFAAMNWLEDTLRAYRGAVMIVSHDRLFLNRTVTAIVEIDEHSRAARTYTGDYDAYTAAKRLERRKWELDFERQQEEIKALYLAIKVTSRRNDNYRAPSDGDKMLTNARKANHEDTVSKRIHSAEEKLKRIEADPIPRPPAPLQFHPDFDTQTLKGRHPLVVSGLSQSFGDKCVLDDVSFTLGLRDRVVIVGVNGAGKSTLLKIITGAQTPASGSVYINPAVRLGVLDQEGESLDPAQTVFEAYAAGLPETEQQLKATLLKSGLFRYDDFGLRVGQLSSGQRRKLQIARAIAERANLLLLDEPTNHVSFDVLEAFEDALADFPGPILAVSHDRRFIARMEQIGGHVWELSKGTLRQNQVEYLSYS